MCVCEFSHWVGKSVVCDDVYKLIMNKIVYTRDVIYFIYISLRITTWSVKYICILVAHTIALVYH